MDEKTRSTASATAKPTFRHALGSDDYEQQYEYLTRAVHDPRTAAEIVDSLGDELRSEEQPKAIPWGMIRTVAIRSGRVHRMLAAITQVLRGNRFVGGNVALLCAALVSATILLGDVLRMEPTDPLYRGTAFLAATLLAVAVLAAAAIVSWPRNDGVPGPMTVAAALFRYAAFAAAMAIIAVIPLWSPAKILPGWYTIARGIASPQEPLKVSVPPEFRGRTLTLLLSNPDSVPSLQLFNAEGRLLKEVHGKNTIRWPAEDASGTRPFVLRVTAVPETRAAVLAELGRTQPPI